MKVLVLNSGSSSIKCALYDFKKSPKSFSPPLWKGEISWKNTQKSPIKALEKLLQSIDISEIDAVGHRIVHGGPYFKKSTLITPSVKKKIGELSDLAPLHNAAELAGVELMETLLKKTPQIAVFDTAFHHTMPEVARIYPGPYEWFEKGIMRYGFHGISFQYCSKQTKTLLKKTPKRLIICHLGSGASLCALKNGKSIDTTMGFTPLEGLMMDTRSGSIDPGILLYLKQKNLSHTLYDLSGLLGISGLSSDMRDIISLSKKNKRAKLALDLYIHRLNACIGSMIASLNGLDALVFTGGIGENAALIRERVCANLSHLDVKLDPEKNTSAEEDRLISKTNSKVSMLVIHTQETFEIAASVFEKLL